LIDTIARLVVIFASIEHGQLAAVRLWDNLGRIIILVALVLSLPRLELALDVGLRTLRQIFLGDRHQRLVENHDAAPFGSFSSFAADLVLPAFRCGDRQVAHAAAGLQGATSGSLPRLPIRMTLLTDPAMVFAFG